MHVINPINNPISWPSLNEIGKYDNNLYWNLVELKVFKLDILRNYV